MLSGGVWLCRDVLNFSFSALLCLLEIYNVLNRHMVFKDVPPKTRVLSVGEKAQSQIFY